MHSEWERAAAELLAEGGHDGPAESAFCLARDLGINVFAGERHWPAQLLPGPPVTIRVDERLSRAQQEGRVALELARYALRRAGYGAPSEFRVRLVAERLIKQRPLRRPLAACSDSPQRPTGSFSAAACAKTASFPSG